MRTASKTTYPDGITVTVRPFTPAEAPQLGPPRPPNDQRAAVHVGISAEGSDVTVSCIDLPLPETFDLYIWTLRDNEVVQKGIEHFTGQKTRTCTWGAGNGHGVVDVQYAVPWLAAVAPPDPALFVVHPEDLVTFREAMTGHFPAVPVKTSRWVPKEAVWIPSDPEEPTPQVFREDLADGRLVWNRAPLRHVWTKEEVDGGQLGAEDFWACTVCGAGGGMADDRPPPFFPPFLPGCAFDVTHDCRLAQALMACWKDLGIEPWPAGLGWITTSIVDP